MGGLTPPSTAPEVSRAQFVANLVERPDQRRIERTDRDWRSGRDNVLPPERHSFTTTDSTEYASLECARCKAGSVAPYSPLEWHDFFVGTIGRVGRSDRVVVRHHLDQPGADSEVAPTAGEGGRDTRNLGLRSGRVGLRTGPGAERCRTWYRDLCCGSRHCGPGCLGHPSSPRGGRTESLDLPPSDFPAASERRLHRRGTEPRCRQGRRPVLDTGRHPPGLRCGIDKRLGASGGDTPVGRGSALGSQLGKGAERTANGTPHRISSPKRPSGRADASALITAMSWRLKSVRGCRRRIS